MNSLNNLAFLGSRMPSASISWIFYQLTGRASRARTGPEPLAPDHMRDLPTGCSARPSEHPGLTSGLLSAATAGRWSNMFVRGLSPEQAAEDAAPIADQLFRIRL